MHFLEENIISQACNYLFLKNERGTFMNQFDITIISYNETQKWINLKQIYICKQSKQYVN